MFYFKKLTPTRGQLCACKLAPHFVVGLVRNLYVLLKQDTKSVNECLQPLLMPYFVWVSKVIYDSWKIKNWKRARTS